MAEGISISYKDFAKKLQEKCVLQQPQFKKKVSLRYQKIIEATIDEKLHWECNSEQVKVCAEIL